MLNSIQTLQALRPVVEVDEDTAKKMLEKDFHPMSCIKEIDIEHEGRTKYNGRLVYRLRSYINGNYVMPLEALELEYFGDGFEPNCTLRCDYDLLRELIALAICERR